MFKRHNWCWLLGHTTDYKCHDTIQDMMFLIPAHKRCKHCGKNLGEMK